MMAQPKPLLPMTGAEENRHYLRAFIQTYRDLPVLWDTALRDYTNREKRAEAYEQLVPIYRYLKRDATIEDVKKKINTLRTNYRKELKVVESARRAGSMHHPRCWTFHELDFLRNTEKFLAVNPNVRGEHYVFNENSQTQASFIDTNSAYNFKALHSPPPSVTEMFQKSFGQHATPKYEPQQSQSLLVVPPPSLSLPPPTATPTHQTAASTSQHSQGPNNCYGTTSMSQTTAQQHDMMNATAAIIKRQRLSPTTTANGHNSEELLNIARDYLSASYPEEETISRTWAFKLKRLQREQRLLAEKFINDILFEAESGTLHRCSMQINAFEPYVRYEEQSNEDSTDEHVKSQSPIVHPSSSTPTTMETTEARALATPTTAATTTTAVAAPAASVSTVTGAGAGATSQTTSVNNAGNESNFTNYS